jgi:hypothetical protein
MVGAMSAKGVYFDNMLEPKSSESDNFELFFSSKYGDFAKHLCRNELKCLQINVSKDT